MALPNLLPDWPSRYRWRRHRRADSRPAALRVPNRDAGWHALESEVRAMVREAAPDPAGDLERERWTA